jgi:phosphoenolpyruvate carboxykinase (GTP)
MISFKDLPIWIEEMKELLKPSSVHWCDGSQTEYQKLLDDMVEQKKVVKLNESKRPNSYAFFSDPTDVARVEERTFISTMNQEDAGPTNHWIHPFELKDKMRSLYEGSMKGRTMYIIPFMMGPFGSKLSLIGIQITDSPYVVVNMKIMTRMGTQALHALENRGYFIPCLHSVGYPLEENQDDLPWPSAPIEHKYISHFMDEKLIWSYGSGYGGNALLGKKCLALRIASVLAKEQDWMAEHMLILKVTNPKGHYKYMLGAFPSACGKTNLATMQSKLPGWTIETIGDDIAWIWIKKDGHMYAINPEKGFFGVAKRTNYETNPNMMETIKANTLFTNVALTDDSDVWWEGMDGDLPSHLIDWKGENWNPSMNHPPNHPNSRFTASIEQCPSAGVDWDNPEGVKISAILFGGRRANTVPLVYEAKNWNHGVFMGSICGSEITAAMITNRIGEVRRDPFAMLPFMGYHIGDYMQHWIDMGKKTDPHLLPKIYFINWFRKDDSDEFLWPGFGENARVLKWIFERSDGIALSDETVIGNIPKLDQLDVRGLNIHEDQMKKLLKVDKTEWIEEVQSIEAFYNEIGQKCPKELMDELKSLKERLLTS